MSEPRIDPRTVLGLWMETIQEAKNEATSMEIAFHTFKGMEHNIATRDPETGWCYKNGGRAPYPYRAVRVARGKNSKGEDIVKTIWGVDETKAEVVRWMIRELRVRQGLSAQWAPVGAVHRVRVLPPRVYAGA